MLAARGMDIESLGPEARSSKFLDSLEDITDPEMAAIARSALGGLDTSLELVLEQIRTGTPGPQIIDGH